MQGGAVLGGPRAVDLDVQWIERAVMSKKTVGCQMWSHFFVFLIHHLGIFHDAMP